MKVLIGIMWYCLLMGSWFKISCGAELIIATFEKDFRMQES